MSKALQLPHDRLAWYLNGVIHAVHTPVYMNVDGNRRIHNEDGPAIVWNDDWCVYALMGMRVPKQYVTDAQSVPPNDILHIANVEIRRLMIRKYGQDNLVKNMHLEPYAKDDYGELYRCDIPGDEPMVMVKVVNSTPEGLYHTYEDELEPVEVKVPVTKQVRVGPMAGKPQVVYETQIQMRPKRVFEPELDKDGNYIYKDYWLRVPPNSRTPREAVAWTFNVDARDYVPRQQT